MVNVIQSSSLPGEEVRDYELKRGVRRGPHDANYILALNLGNGYRLLYFVILLLLYFKLYIYFVNIYINFTYTL